MHKFFALLIMTLGFSISTVVAQKAPSVDDPAEVAYQKRILKSRINGVYIPKDLYDAFAQLNRLMDAPTRKQLQLMTEEEAGKKLYLIMWICNNWGMYEGSRLSHYIQKMGISNPEHKAHFLITTYHRELNKKDLGLKERVEFYQKKTEEAKARKAKKGKVIHEETRQRPRN